MHRVRVGVADYLRFWVKINLKSLYSRALLGNVVNHIMCLYLIVDLVCKLCLVLFSVRSTFRVIQLDADQRTV